MSLVYLPPLAFIHCGILSPLFSKLPTEHPWIFWKVLPIAKVAVRGNLHGGRGDVCSSLCVGRASGMWYEGSEVKNSKVAVIGI